MSSSGSSCPENRLRTLVGKNLTGKSRSSALVDDVAGHCETHSQGDVVPRGTAPNFDPEGSVCRLRERCAFGEKRGKSGPVCLENQAPIMHGVRAVQIHGRPFPTAVIVTINKIALVGPLADGAAPD